VHSGTSSLRFMASEVRVKGAIEHGLDFKLHFAAHTDCSTPTRMPTHALTHVHTHKHAHMHARTHTHTQAGPHVESVNGLGRTHVCVCVSARGS